VSDSLKTVLVTMDVQHSTVPPLSAYRRAQIHQILTEYGNKQATSNSPQDGSAMSDRTPGGASMAGAERDGAQDGRSDVQDTMEKLRQLIPDRM
jgi:hypothetical protein